MKILSSLKRNFTITSEDLEFIKQYKKIHQRVLQEAKKRDNDRYVTDSSNKSKAIWQLINREISMTQEDDNKLELKRGNNIDPNPIESAEKLNMYFMYTVAEMVQQNINKESYNNSRKEMNHCPNSIFISPVTEENVVNLAKNLKDKPTAGYNDIPEILVKQCIQLIKGPLTPYHCGQMNGN